ncbi:MAG: ATPase [Alphaproteobacteria bacterium]|nr:MAG: ATPase [Alphaproteobacteria bacterium]
MKKTAHIIVFGNEKGGSGKSTTAMHTAIALLRLGYRVGTIDLDARQGTLTRYLKKRFDYITRNREHLPSPAHMAIQKSQKESVKEQKFEEEAFLLMGLDELERVCDFIIIDTPGTDSFLSRLAHSHADTLITPMNDSFIDLDLLADIDMKNYDVVGPSIYSKMVEEQRQVKKQRDGGAIDWIVMRNRMTHLNTNNNKIITRLLGEISRLAKFRLAPGFGERVVFKEMFLKGLTLLDLKEDQNGGLTLSQIAARQEVRNLIIEIAPEHLKGHARPPQSQVKTAATG